MALSATACGVPTDSSAQGISAQAVPFNLLKAGQDNRAPVVARQPSTYTHIFLVGNNQHLVQVTRIVKAPVQAKGLLQDLLAGPTDAESAAGLSSAVPDRTRLRSAETTLGVITLDLTQAFGQVSGREEVLAVAQIVYTATGLPGVTGVIFDLSGKPVEVPDGKGTLVQGPVTRSDYRAVAPG